MVIGRDEIDVRRNDTLIHAVFSPQLLVRLKGIPGTLGLAPLHDRQPNADIRRWVWMGWLMGAGTEERD